MLLPWKSYRVALFLWSNLCFRFRFDQFKKTCFELRFRFVVTANLSSVFKGWKISRWRVFHKNLFATKEGGEKKELVWLRDPCKICHFNVCCGCIGIFLASFFHHATRGVFPVNSSEVLRRFVNSCGNIANASNGDGAKGGK